MECAIIVYLNYHICQHTQGNTHQLQRLRILFLMSTFILSRCFWFVKRFFLLGTFESTSSVSVCLYVQVFQQALHRQPNTAAAQYLQQMYAAQQQHLMLQTAALQQQHSLSTAQLQSLAAVQQVGTRLPETSFSRCKDDSAIVDLSYDVL